MTHTNRHDADASDRFRTRTEFATEFEALVARARDAGIDLQGAYDVRSPGDQPDYTVEISEVVKRSERR